jgi:hypothetical protein
LALAFVVVITVGCTGDDQAGQPPTTTAPPPAQTITNLPEPVMETRAAILQAASARDYEAVGRVMDRKLFLSDYGFGADSPDPIPRWRKLGDEPLETMAALLQMPHVVHETNEGTLYQWPRFTPDSTLAEVSQPERDVFLTFMSDEELEGSFRPEYGYLGPRLGILANGSWWFFILRPSP